jgi:PPOX class probable F420-dependent enzyme
MLGPNDTQAATRLRDNIIVWFTSVRPDGHPHSVPVWFLWDGTTILVFSKPKNQKIVNLRHNPNVLLALDDTKEGDEVVIVEGTAELVDDTSLSAAVPAYVAKYGALIQQIGMTPESMAAEYAQAIRVTPTRFISW